MSNRLNGFNRIAPYYDRLKRLVFGKALEASQLPFLGCIPGGAHVLIVGGGSGEILAQLLDINPTARIAYLDASTAMLEMARARVSPAREHQVTFIHGTETTLQGEPRFDAVIANFLLDLFPEERVKQMIAELQGKLLPGGLWLIADFVDEGKWWQKALLRGMYGFFRVICGIEASGLPRWEKALVASGLTERMGGSFFGGFIRSSVYVRSDKGVSPL